MRSLWRWVVASGLMLATLGCAAQDCGPYRVGVREYPVFYQRMADGSFGGLDKDFFTLLAERSGCRLEFQFESQPRLWHKLAAGEVDLASWVIPSKQRATLVKVIPLVGSRLQAMTWRDAGVKNEAAFLANPALTAVAVRQSLYGKHYDALLRRLHAEDRLSEVADFDTALRAFSARRVALLIVAPWSLASQPPGWMAQVRLADWDASSPTVVSGLALSHRTVREVDAQRLEKALETMRQDGSLAQLLARHRLAEAIKVLP